MNATTLRELLDQLLNPDDDGQPSVNSIGEAPVRVLSFQEAGLRTPAEGLVVQMEDGSEFRITVVQTAYAIEG